MKPLRSSRPSPALAAVLLLAGLSGPRAGEDPAAGEKKKPSKQTKVIISKETTHILGPLRDDGYVDYIAALEARQSHGVTSQNNAAIPFWKALGPSWIDEEVRARYFAKLGMDPLPEEGPYLKSLQDFDDEFWESAARGEGEEEPEDGDEWEREEPTGPSEQVVEALQRPWSRSEFPDLARWLAENEEPLTLIIEASSRERFCTPLVGGGKFALFGLWRGELTGISQAGRALAARATLKLGEGKWQSPTEDLLACHRLARLVAQGPTMIDRLVAVAVDQMAVRGDALLAHHGQLTRAQLESYRKQLKELPPPPGAMETLDTGERWFFLDSICALARDPDALTRMDGGPRRDGLGPAMRRVLLGMAFDWNEILREGNRWYDRYVEASRHPTYQKRAEALGVLDAELVKLTNEAMHPLRRFTGGLTREGRSKMAAPLLLGLVLPSTNSAGRRVQEALQRVQLTDVAFCLAAYRTEHGAYPETLGKLRGKYLDEIPRDLFTAEELKYRPSGKGYVLYSVGQDGKDGGGQEKDEDWSADDIVLELEAATGEEEEG